MNHQGQKRNSLHRRESLRRQPKARAVNAGPQGDRPGFTIVTVEKVETVFGKGGLRTETVKETVLSQIRPTPTPTPPHPAPAPAPPPNTPPPNTPTPTIANVPTPNPPPVVPIVTSSSVVPVPVPTSSSTTSIAHTTTTPSTSKPTSHLATSSTVDPTVELVSASTSAATTPVSATSNKSLAAGVGVGLTVLAVLACIAVFLIRRSRKKNPTKGLNPIRFRNSAILLDDPSEKPDEPHPPTMSQRHLDPLAVPSPIYPFSEAGSAGGPELRQLGATRIPSPPPAAGADSRPHAFGDSAPRQYDAPPEFSSQAQYDAYGAPINSYDAQPPYGYSQQELGAPPPSSGRYAPYDSYGSGQQSARYQRPNNPPQAQPDVPYSHPIAPISMARTQSMASSASSSSRALPATPTIPTTFLRRQNTQTGGAPPAYEDDDGTYSNMKRDVKTPTTLTYTLPPESPPVLPPKPPALSSVYTPSIPNDPFARPPSAYTLYNPEDAYGGM